MTFFPHLNKPCLFLYKCLVVLPSSVRPLTKVGPSVDSSVIVCDSPSIQLPTFLIVIFPFILLFLLLCLTYLFFSWFLPAAFLLFAHFFIFSSHFCLVHLFLLSFSPEKKWARIINSGWWGIMSMCWMLARGRLHNKAMEYKPCVSGIQSTFKTTETHSTECYWLLHKASSPAYTVDIQLTSPGCSKYTSTSCRHTQSSSRFFCIFRPVINEVLRN